MNIAKLQIIFNKNVESNPINHLTEIGCVGNRDWIVSERKIIFKKDVSYPLYSFEKRNKKPFLKFKGLKEARELELTDKTFVVDLSKPENKDVGFTIQYNNQ